MTTMTSTEGNQLWFHSLRLSRPCWQESWDIWNITNKNQVSLLCDLAWVVILHVNPWNSFLRLRWLSQVQTITTPFISSNIGDIVQDIYTQMVDVDQDTLFQMHAGADYLDIKPLLELTSLAILIGYIWVSVFYVRFLMELWHASSLFNNHDMKIRKDLQRIFKECSVRVWASPAWF